MTTPFGTADLVRFKIGDTDASTPLLSDDEIAQCIVDWPDNVDMAAANAAEAIAAQFAGAYDFQTDGQAFTRSQQYANFKALADTLRARGGGLESS